MQAQQELDGERAHAYRPPVPLSKEQGKKQAPPAVQPCTAATPAHAPTPSHPTCVEVREHEHGCLARNRAASLDLDRGDLGSGMRQGGWGRGGICGARRAGVYWEEAHAVWHGHAWKGETLNSA